ncbi:MAG: hypothetical protein ABIB04_03930 [Patescibacteria group bacterium]
MLCTTDYTIQERFSVFYKNHRYGGFYVGGGSLSRFEPETKGLVKKRMTVDEYLAHQTEEETADSKRVSSILDSEMEVWLRVHWRLSEELFLFWYIWLKDNTAMVERFVEELKSAVAKNQT